MSILQRLLFLPILMTVMVLGAVASAYMPDSTWQNVVQGIAILLTLVGLGFMIMTTRQLRVTLQEAHTMLASMNRGDLHPKQDMEDSGELEGLLGALTTFSKQLHEEVEIMAGNLASGNFSFSSEGIVQPSLQQARQRLGGTVHAMHDTGDQVVQEADQISNAFNTLLQGVEDQNSALKEVTSSLASVDEQTKSNVDKASSAYQLSLSASFLAQQGDDQMQQMLQAMRAISESSDNISQVIKVVDEIAFQTNMLALNAAVEAARAGDHGKGFAVVAEEVRNLAQRSSSAAKETTELVETSLARVEAGTELTHQTAKTFNEIVNSVNETSELVDNIVVDSGVQSKGIQQVHTALATVNTISQNNINVFSSNAASIQQLASQALHLRQIVNQFTVYGSYNEVPSSEPTPVSVSPPVEEPMPPSAPSSDTSIIPSPMGVTPSMASTELAPAGTILSDDDFGKF